MTPAGGASTGGLTSRINGLTIILTQAHLIKEDHVGVSVNDVSHQTEYVAIGPNNTTARVVLSGFHAFRNGTRERAKEQKRYLVRCAIKKSCINHFRAYSLVRVVV